MDLMVCLFIYFTRVNRKVKWRSNRGQGRSQEPKNWRKNYNKLTVSDDESWNRWNRTAYLYVYMFVFFLEKTEKKSK